MTETIKAPIIMGLEEHAARINEAWQKTLDGVIETGLRILDARHGSNALPHGDFEDMVRSKLNFAPSTARSLMAIASNKVLANRQYVDDLPASWGTLYDLTVIANRGYDLEAGIESGAIHPKMERKDVKALLPPPQRYDDLEETEPDPEDDAGDGAPADDADDLDEKANTFIRRALEFTSDYANGFRAWQKIANVSDEEREALADTLHQCANELSILAQEVQGFTATIDDDAAAEQPKKRGRPKGSKNKPKVEEPIAATVPVDAAAAAEERKAFYAATEPTVAADQDAQPSTLMATNDPGPIPEFLRRTAS